MEQSPFSRQLELLALLAQGEGMRIADLARHTQLNPRSIYRHLDFFRRAGFTVQKSGARYSIDPRSPFFRRISDGIHFTEEEALTLFRALMSVNHASPQVRHLREKLSRIYDFQVLASHAIDKHIAANFSALYQAIHEERLCVLHAYSSPHSKATTDRVIEPYLFLAENSEVRAYEPASGLNKTFKISRAAQVQLLDLKWSFRDKHERVFTDLFHFSGTAQLPVKLRLGRLAASLLQEEFPFAAEELVQENDAQFLFTTKVCSYVGIGRFVLGLFDDIELVDSPDFQAYLSEAITRMQYKLK